MPNVAVYSFTDIKLVLNHPSWPPFVLDGSGVGEFRIEPGGNSSALDIAADGAAMISKIKAPHRHFSIQMQQVSNLNGWCNGLFNYLDNAPSALWALMTVDITSLTGMFAKSRLSGVCFEKTADAPFAQQGQMVTWNFLCANGKNNGSVVSAVTGVMSAVTNVQAFIQNGP